MRTLGTGKKSPQGQARLAQYQHSEAGFTLIEFLVAIAVMAVLMGIAVLTIPNHDERYWRDNLDQLVSSLNFAQEESTMSGTPMVAQVDGLGWRFSMPLSAVSAAGSNPGGTFLPDVYRAQIWHKPVEIISMQLSLGGERITEPLQIPIKQENRQAVLVRSTNGHFQWVRP
jgi:prepilin-type N-terminal cleavage/methylation domain-containing protein